MTGWLISLAIIFFIWLIGLLSAGANWGGPHLNWLDGWTRILCKTLHGLGKQRLKLPESGPVIVAANHVSGLDPMMLIAASSRPLRFLIAREQYQKPVVNWLFRAAGCIPVDRSGRPEQALRQALRALQQGEVIALFPQGAIHLDHEPSKPLKRGVVKLAQWAAAPLIPVRIDGVRGQGSVFLAPFLMDRVSLTQRETLHIGNADEQQMLEKLSQSIGPQIR